MQFLALLAAFLSITPALAFPGFSPLDRRATSSTNCFPKNRKTIRAPQYSKKYPYTGAVIDGKPGNGRGGGLVPLPGDNDHKFQKPEPGAYRGPCPGLNVIANYGFLSRDGVTSFDELVAAAQNVYNFGWDLSVALSAVGVGADGDPDTGLLSIGADASCTGEAIGGGLNQHDAFEGDASLTRNDIFLGPNFENAAFNGTLFKLMTDYAAFYSTPENPIYSREAIAAFKSARWEHSRVHNGNFHFGPGQLITYGAAAIVYSTLGGNGQPDYNSISHIFGAKKNSKGGYDFTNEEKLPTGWRTRDTPWSLRDVGDEIRRLYISYPKVLGNQANFNWTSSERQLNPTPSTTDVLCSLYDSVTSRGQPGPNPLPYKRLKFITDRVNQIFSDEGCAVLVPEPY